MICLSVAEKSFEKCEKILKENELVELRLDLCKFSDEDVKKLFSIPTNIIACYRPDKKSEEERSKQLKIAMEAGASYVDIELEAPDNYKKELIKTAKENKCKIIISYHNYEKTPLIEELKQVLSWCFDSGADIAKIACLSNSQAENARLISLYDQKEGFDKKIIVIGMGEKAKFTRVASIVLGAPFTYVSESDDKKTALGQIDKFTMKQLLEQIKKIEETK